MEPINPWNPITEFAELWQGIKVVKSKNYPELWAPVTAKNTSPSLPEKIRTICEWKKVVSS